MAMVRLVLEVIGKWLEARAMVDGTLSKKIRNSIAGARSSPKFFVVWK
jgi:hypothetical protein